MAYSESTHEASAKPKKLHHLRIHPHKGGHLVTHHSHHPMGGHEEQPYHSQVFSHDQGEALLAHISKHAKVRSETGEEAEPYGESNKLKDEPSRTEAEEKGED